MPLVEDLARRRVLGVVGRARRLVPAQRRLDLGRQVGPQAVGLCDEVGNDAAVLASTRERSPPGCVSAYSWREESAPRLAEHVMAGADPEGVHEVVQLATNSSTVQKSAPRSGKWVLLPLPSWS